MGLFKFFKPAPFDAVEAKGDRLFEAGSYGPAKQAYEAALVKLEKSSMPEALRHCEHIRQKLGRARESLAAEHMASAQELLEAGYDADAVELLELARDLTDSADRKSEIEKLLDRRQKLMMLPAADIAAQDISADGEFPSESDDTYFHILCSALPQDLQTAYESYGPAFKLGYVALNQGAFAEAADRLSEALAQQGEPASHVQLELATAWLNLGNIEKSRDLLLPYLERFPLALRAYELLCEIYWEEHAFELAEELISGCPDEIKTSIPIMLLMGETLFRRGKLRDAAAFYQNSLNYTGWNEEVATALAKTFEAMDAAEDALKTYAEIMNACRSCSRQVSPFVKQRYAELSVEAGKSSSSLLDLYFSLCHEDSQNRPHYYRRISQIYTRQGYPDEAKRYSLLSQAGEKASD